MAAVLSSQQTATAAASDIRTSEVSSRALTRLLLSLKWTLWKRSYRNNVGKLIGTIFGVLYGLFGLGLLVFLFLGTTLWTGEGSTFPMIIRGVGAVTVLAWLLIPLLAFGVDDTLDPSTFAQYPRRARELQSGMFAAAAISLPVLFTVLAVAIATAFEVIWLLAFGQGALWIALAVIALLPANLAGVVLCVLLPRAVFAHSASRSTSRSGREAGGIVGMVVLIGGAYGVSLLFQSLPGSGLSPEAMLDALRTGAEILAWTPFGALFAVPMDLAEGAPLVALARLLIGLAAIVLVWRWWQRSIDLSLTSALSGDASSGDVAVKPLVPRFAPATAFGAVLGRSLRYWRRDTRYLAAVGVYPLVIVFMTAMGFVLPETRPMMLGFILFMCGITGITLANEIGLDGPSNWVNITAHLPSRANQLGRVAAMAVLMVPAIVLVTAGVPLLYGMAWIIPLMVLGALGMAITGWGVSLAVNVIMPYPASPPGTNPMKDKSASSANAMIAMTVAMLGVFVPQIPAVGLAVWGLVISSAPLQLAAGVVSLIIGAITFLVGLRIGTVRLRSRYPDLFQKVRDFV